MSEPLSQEEVDRIADALAAGRKIEAIKIYREVTGQGLKQAKDFIDALIPKLREQDPERFAGLSTGPKVGCGSAVLVCLAIGSVAVTVAAWVA
jgi:hypothetical protein